MTYVVYAAQQRDGGQAWCAIGQPAHCLPRPVFRHRQCCTFCLQRVRASSFTTQRCRRTNCSDGYSHFRAHGHAEWARCLEKSGRRSGAPRMFSPGKVQNHAVGWGGANYRFLISSITIGEAWITMETRVAFSTRGLSPAHTNKYLCLPPPPAASPPPNPSRIEQLQIRACLLLYLNYLRERSTQGHFLFRRGRSV